MQNSDFEDLVEVIKKLRHPVTGCPWDLKQTHKSLLEFLVEECYEFIHATELEDPKEMEEELGDILLQVLLHSAIGEEKGNFTLASVSRVLATKLKRRHPHVFGQIKEKIEAHTVVKNWEKIKETEKESQNKQHKYQKQIDESYLVFPALFSANKIGEKTNKIGFDWDCAEEVISKVEEEWHEFSEELKQDRKDPKVQKKLEEEYGDFLFSVAQLGRHLGFNSEESLRAANKKFIRRFNQMEEMIHKSEYDLVSMNQKKMDIFWDQVKHSEIKNRTK
ncbi:MAG: nucleoside triphosphate pyrophosphohydrolase [Bacteriovoracaceae bacterium]|nr:nucleoside triphosphate pyrophosphohydrolase [Bacteriovoracaceae bacterium]